MRNQLSVSVFAADILHMGDSLDALQGLDISSLHVDIMDGHFVPLYGFNPAWLRDIYHVCKIPMDFHFMASLTPEMLERFYEFHPSIMTIHVEAQNGEQNIRLLREIKRRGIKAGVAIAPETELSELSKVLPFTDEILVMTSEPGREGSHFLDDSCERIREMKNRIGTGKITIAVDGGIDLERARKCIRIGANRIIMGRSFFCSSGKMELVRELTSF